MVRIPKSIDADGYRNTFHHTHRIQSNLILITSSITIRYNGDINYTILRLL